jgi:hypothetical protein
MPISASATIPRRSALTVLAAAAGALALVSCERDKPSGTPPGPTPSQTPAGPDPLLTDLTDTERLLTVYDQVLRAHPTLAARLRPLRANHAAHLSALREATGVTATPTAAPPKAPATPAAALAQLRGLERTATAARTRSAVRASGGRAALLASIAACCATHQAVLAP